MVDLPISQPLKKEIAAVRTLMLLAAETPLRANLGPNAYCCVCLVAFLSGILCCRLLALIVVEALSNGTPSFSFLVPGIGGKQ